MAGRPKKYKTAAALKKKVDAYFASISYEEPAVVTTPTGEVDEMGRPRMTARMLREGKDGSGAVKRTVKFLQPPTMAGLCLYLGISRETWRCYGEDDILGPVVEEARLRAEDYWMGHLTGKGAQGAKFILTAGYGYSERMELTHKDGGVEDYLRRMEAGT